MVSHSHITRDHPFSTSSELCVWLNVINGWPQKINRGTAIGHEKRACQYGCGLFVGVACLWASQCGRGLPGSVNCLWLEAASDLSAQLWYARHKNWVRSKDFNRQIPDHCLNIQVGRTLPQRAGVGGRRGQQGRQRRLGRHELKVQTPTQRHCNGNGNGNRNNYVPATVVKPLQVDSNRCI